MEKKIDKVRDDWFICTIKIQGRIACGYGITKEKAEEDALRDWALIQKL
jgi:hypothetical protein